MGQAEIITFTIVFSLLVIIILSTIILFVIKYKQRQSNYLISQKLTATKHQQQLLSTQLEMQTQTMQHIGREIHDNIGQKLTLASLYTQQLAYENKAPQVTDKIENISNIINESLAELRQLSKSLTNDTINEHDIVELLQIECDKVNDLKKCNVAFSSNQTNISLPYQIKSIVLRIVQEFLQNSIKHAECKKIIVNISAATTTLQLFLQDDGKGFDITNTNEKGIGLSNIKKRTELIDGTYNLQSKIGAGTQLNITIPL
jgi:signal transduction histidine kinase